MKTAVSLPDRVFREAERLAKRQRKTRSRLYADAISEYVSRHDPDAVVRRINAVVAVTDASLDPLVREAARRVLRRTEWTD